MKDRDLLGRRQFLGMTGFAGLGLGSFSSSVSGGETIPDARRDRAIDGDLRDRILRNRWDCARAVESETNDRGIEGHLVPRRVEQDVAARSVSSLTLRVGMERQILGRVLYKAARTCSFV